MDKLDISELQKEGRKAINKHQRKNEIREEGYYQNSQPGNASFFSGKGEIWHPDYHAEDNDWTERVEFNITVDEALEVMAKCEEKKGGKYDLFSENCATFAQDCMKVINQPIPQGKIFKIIEPKELARKLRSRRKKSDENGEYKGGIYKGQDFSGQAL